MDVAGRSSGRFSQSATPSITPTSWTASSGGLIGNTSLEHTRKQFSEVRPVEEAMVRAQVLGCSTD